jgi:hypothetical protein
VDIRSPSQASRYAKRRQSACAAGAVDAGEDALFRGAECCRDCGCSGIVGARCRGWDENEGQNGDDREE